jgi:hypothetical protein
MTRVTTTMTMPRVAMRTAAMAMTMLAAQAPILEIVCLLATAVHREAQGQHRVM